MPARVYLSRAWPRPSRAMTTENKTQIAKEGDAPAVQEITDPEAVEVSLVGRPANQEPFLLIKSASGEGEQLKLPIDAEGILALAKRLSCSGEHLSKLSAIVVGAVSEEGATFPESLTAEITKAVELLGEHYKPTEVEKTETESAETEDLEKNLDPITAFMVTVQAIREKLSDIRFDLEDDPNGALVGMQQVMGMLQNAITSYPSAIATTASPTAFALAADDLAKCRAELPESEVKEVLETVKLLKQLEVAIRPSASIQKSFDEYRTAAKSREAALKEQNQRLRKALKEAVTLASARVTPLTKSLGTEPRPTPQSTGEGVLSQTSPAQPETVHWGDLAAEVEAEEQAAKGGH